jgi:hypothetical protein
MYFLKLLCKKCDEFMLILIENVIYLQMMYEFVANKAQLQCNYIARTMQCYCVVALFASKLSKKNN